jgi:F0F1-type ATP synthase membrane subunit a
MGFIQAVIFAVLALVFVAIATAHESDPAHVQAER